MALSWLAAAEILTTGLGTELLRVDGGRYVRGMSGGEGRIRQAFPLSISAQFYGNAESPAHLTWITKPFYLAKTEVTRGEFAAFVEATGYRTSAESGQTEMVGWSPTPVDKPLYQSHDFARTNAFSWRAPGFEQTDDHPVVGVSHADARAFITWLSARDNKPYRLPTEAEWEFACRAGTTTWFSFGDQPEETIHRHANVGNVELERHRTHSVERQWLLDWERAPDDGYIFTAPVGRFAANPLGFHDLHGNVWEWCEDLWLDTEYKAQERPTYNAPHGIAVDPVNLDRPQTPANDFHVIRGGCWYNGPVLCRSSGRMFWDREDAACYIGFRLALDAEGEGARPAYEAATAARATITRLGGVITSSRGLDLRIEFRGRNFREAELAVLHDLPQLRSLSFSTEGPEAALTQAGIALVGSLASLEELTIQANCDLAVVDLTPLAGLPLTSLTLGRSMATKDEQLQQLAGLTTLERFSMHGTSGGVSDAGLRALAGNRALREMAVWETDVTGDFLAAYDGVPLTEFRSSRRYNGEATWTPAGARNLARFPGLTGLVLNEQTLLDEDLISVLTALPDLTHLELRGCTGIADNAFAGLAGLMKLRSLDLRGSPAGDAMLGPLVALPRLETLYLGSDSLSDAGLAALPKLFTIRQLILESDRISDAGLAALAQVNRLRELELQSTAITGSGLMSLASLPELQSIKLRCPGLTDVVFDALVEIRTLRKIRLAERGIQPAAALTDAGLLRIAPAIWLSELWLPRNDTGMTEATMTALKTRMPKTGVIPYTVQWK